jgi:hypothetical protein
MPKDEVIYKIKAFMRQYLNIDPLFVMPSFEGVANKKKRKNL